MSLEKTPLAGEIKSQKSSNKQITVLPSSTSCSGVQSSNRMKGSAEGIVQFPRTAETRSQSDFFVSREGGSKGPCPIEIEVGRKIQNQEFLAMATGKIPDHRQHLVEQFASGAEHALAEPYVD